MTKHIESAGSPAPLLSPEELRAERKTQELLSQPSPWLEGKESASQATSKAVIISREELRTAYDTQEDLQKPSPWLNKPKA